MIKLISNNVLYVISDDQLQKVRDIYQYISIQHNSGFCKPIHDVHFYLRHI